jgi:putative ABC transport system permease protein
MLRLALRRPRRAAHDMDEEVEFHLAERIDRLMTLGWSRDAARAEAYRRFGPFDDTMRALRFAAREREEKLRMLDTIRDTWQDVRFGVRMLRRYPAFAAGVVITLAVGIGAASAMLLAPLPFAEQDRLVFMAEESSSEQPMPASYPNFADWRERAHSFDALGAFGYSNTLPVLGADEPVTAGVQTVSRGLFELLGVRPIVGRWIAPNENQPGADATILVGERFWREHLGATTNLTAVKLSVFGRQRAVVGVMPRAFELLGRADIWFPMEIDPIRVRGAGNYFVVGRLRHAVPLAVARTEMNRIAAQLKHMYGDETVSSAVVTRSLRDVIIGEAKQPLLVLLAAAIFVLLVTCINVAMMVIVRGNARLRETAVRIALGSGQWRLMRQALAETSTLVILGVSGGLVIAWAGVVTIRARGVGQIPRLNELTFDAGVTAFAMAVATAAALVFSLIPALAAKRVTQATLGAATARASRPSRSWSILVATQAAATVILVVGAALIVRTVENILNVDAGYDPRHVTTAMIPLTSDSYSSDAVRARVGEGIEKAVAAAVPGGIVGLASALPTDHGAGNGPLLVPPFTDPNAQKEWAAIGSTRSVTPGYFSALRIRLVRGRMFDGNDRDGSLEVAVVNQSLAAKLWPKQDPLGKRVRALVDRRGALFTVVGVVADARDWRWAAGSQLELYVPFAQRPASYVDVVVRTATSQAAVTGAVRRVVHMLDSNVPLRISTLSTNLNNTMADRRFIGGMLLAFAVAVLLLTIAGTFGAVSYVVAVRTREIGIRLALGATPSGIWLGVERSMLMILATGTVIGVAVSWIASRALKQLLYGLTAHDAASFVSAPVLVCLAGVAAAALPALRASRTDPSASLRAE